MKITENTIDFNIRELVEWVGNKPKEEVIHSFPYSRNCTITTYLKEAASVPINSTASGEAYTEAAEEVYHLPYFAGMLMPILDDFAGARPADQLTAREVYEILTNTELYKEMV